MISRQFVGLRVFCLLMVCVCGCGDMGGGVSELQSNEPSPVTIERLLPFSGADNVRVETEIKSDKSAEGLTVEGRIVSCSDESLLWEGIIDEINVEPNSIAKTTKLITDLKPQLWSPTSPNLYNLTVTVKKGSEAVASKTVRFGFRSFEAKDGKFLLNGRPLFLRGNSINPPGRGIPKEVGENRKFVEGYIKYLKSKNINIIRISEDSDVWLDVCDELGMMMFQGAYGVPPEATREGPGPDFEKSISGYKALFRQYVKHPSVVIYVLSNEMSKRNPAWAPFFRKVTDTLKPWDGNRAYIDNAGFGLGQGGDIYDSHPYSGWYHGTFVDFLNVRTDRRKDAPAGQPWAFTECVGSYTCPDGRFNIIDKQLATQLMWGGHAANQTQLGVKYQAFLTKQAIELFRRQRSINPSLAGIMPFTIMFTNWIGASSVEEMKAKPAMEQAAVSFQPVLLSWECWTPQVYAGSAIKTTAYVVNDSEDYSDVLGAELIYELTNSAGKVFLEGKVSLPDVPYYGVRSVLVAVNLPAGLQTGNYVLRGRVIKGSEVISQNTFEIFIAGQDWKKANEQIKVDCAIALYDPAGKTADAFRKLGIAFEPLNDVNQLTKDTVLVVGEEAADANFAILSGRLKDFMAGGGRILCLRQKAESFARLPLAVEIKPLQRENKLPNDVAEVRQGGEGMYVNPEQPSHAVFAGLERERLQVWSDYTDWNQNKAGHPKVYPVMSGFKFGGDEKKVQGVDLDANDKPVEFTFAFGGQKSLEKTAVLADYGRGLGYFALCEIFDGDGSMLLSGFDIVNRVEIDPAAERLLKNMVAYTASESKHYKSPLITSPILWGDYSTERGVIAGMYNGLVVNVVLKDFVAGYDNDPNGRWRVPGIFNNNPGVTYVPHGRRPLGAFDYLAICHLVDLNPESKTGTGVFFARVEDGKKTVVSRVKNPAKEQLQMDVEVNGVSAGAVTIPAGSVVNIESNIPDGATELSVRYTGNKKLVILETRFE